MIKVYGIKNCNTVKKALNWLDENNLQYEFIDYKKSGVSEEKLEELVNKFGLEKLVNRKGTTWRKLSADQQEKITDKNFAINLMKEQTSIIKRPIVQDGNLDLIGFDEGEYRKILS